MKNGSFTLYINSFLKIDLYINNIFISNKVSFGEKNFKYFIGYKNYNDYDQAIMYNASEMRRYAKKKLLN